MVALWRRNYRNSLCKINNKKNVGITYQWISFHTEYFDPKNQRGYQTDGGYWNISRIGHLFPTSVDDEDIQNNDPFSELRWAWTKYYYNTDTFIVIPKNADYIDMELLTAVMRGKIIHTTPENSEFTKEDLRSKLTQKQWKNIYHIFIINQSNLIMVI